MNKTHHNPIGFPAHPSSEKQWDFVTREKKSLFNRLLLLLPLHFSPLSLSCLFSAPLSSFFLLSFFPYFSCYLLWAHPAHAGHLQNGRFPWGGGSGSRSRRVCVCGCVYSKASVWPTGHPCTEGPLCTSSVSNTFTLLYCVLLLRHSLSLQPLPILLSDTFMYTHINTHQTAARVLLQAGITHSFQGGKCVVNSVAQSPVHWQWQPVMQPQIQTGSPWSGTSCCFVSCLDENSTQMFSCIIMLLVYLKIMVPIFSLSLLIYSA